MISYSVHPLLEACFTEKMTSVISELFVLNRLIVSELEVRNLWEDGVFAGLHIVPLIGKLLSIRENDAVHDAGPARQEACRIGALLYLGAIRSCFGVHLTPEIHILKLKNAITTWGEISIGETNPLLLWLLIIGGLNSLGHHDNNWFVSAVMTIVRNLQLNTWEDLMNSMGSVLWVQGILQGECTELHKKISEESASFGLLFS